MNHREPEHFISIKKVLLFTFVRVCFESFRRDLNEAKAVNISVRKINVLLFTFVRVSFEYCYLLLSVPFLNPVADLGKGPGPPLFWVKKEEMTEGKKATRASKSIPSPLPHPPPLLSSRSGSATGSWSRLEGIWTDCEQSLSSSLFLFLEFSLRF